MVINLKIHFWNIIGYVNINSKTKQTIFNCIKQKYSLNKFSKNLDISNVSLGHFLKKEHAFIRINNLLGILKNLGFSKHKIEKELTGYKDTSSKGPFLIKFPYFLSPLHFRVVGGLIGDGHIHKTHNLARWIQKDITPMKELIDLIMKTDIYFNKDSSQLVIPAFLRKIICFSLKLEPRSLATEEFLKKCLSMPKDYGLVMLITLIEDEGNIDVKSYGGVNIRMASKKIIFTIKELCDYLGYKTSEIVCYKNNNATFGQNMMYKIKINAEGIIKLGYDILDLEKKFGKEISLWKKKDSFFTRWKKCTGERATKINKGKTIHLEIRKLFEKDRNLSPLQISKKLRIDYNRVYDLIRNMNKRGEIKRIGKGVYALI